MLAAAGETVLGVDSGHPAEAEGLRELGVEVSLDVDGTELLGEVETVVKSPGVPRESPVIEGARSRGKEVTGELELAWRALPNPFCAVTGTNGKTTTTELIGHIHRRPAGPWRSPGTSAPRWPRSRGPRPEAAVVCECSSFQLEDTKRVRPGVRGVPEPRPDHLDRHGTLDAYRDAKLRIFANQGPDDVAVLNGDEPELASRILPAEAGLLVLRGRHPEMSLEDGEIRWQGERLIGTDELPLLGEHNVENAMAAAAASLAMGIGATAVAEGLRSFEGVAHRLERVRQRGRVLFVNDSKATNVASALAAIDAFDGGLRLILGGSLKGRASRRWSGRSPSAAPPSI